MKNEVESLIAGGFDKSTLTLLVVRSFGGSSVSFIPRLGKEAIRRQDFEDLTLLWFTNPHDALTGVISVSQAGVAPGPAGLATGQLRTTELAALLTEQAVVACRTADPGQVVMTLATQELCRFDTPEGWAFSDLGSRPLSHGRICRYFLLEPAEDSGLKFGRVKKFRRRSHFLGRARELSELAHVLRTCRCVSLSGPPGVGKTALASRLVAELADEFDGNTIWVELEDVKRPALLIHRIASALETSWSAQKNTVRRIESEIGDANFLLVLDGIDHLDEPCCDLVSELLSACPNLSILVTCINRLRDINCQDYPLHGLERPSGFEPRQAFLQFDAAVLFVEVAKSADPGFVLTSSTQGEISRVLDAVDGLPWAIQMAAARVSLLTTRQILARLTDDPLAFLTDREKHRGSYANALTLAFAALSPLASVLFARLSVFAWGFTEQAIRAICADDALPPSKILGCLRELMDTHLLQGCHGPASAKSFRLNRICKEFAEKQLHSDERRLITNRLQEYVSEKRRSLWKDGLPSGRESLDEFELLYEDLLATWFRLAANRETAPEVCSDIFSCANYWLQKSYYSEGVSLIKRVMSQLPPESDDSLARLMNLAALCSQKGGDFKTCKRYIRKGLNLAKGRSDLEGCARLLNTAGSMFQALDRPRSSIRCLKAGLRILQSSPNKTGQTIMSSNLAGLLSSVGKFEEAESLLRMADQDLPEVGSWFKTTHLASWAHFHAESGRWADCVRYLQEACDVCLDHPHNELVPDLCLTACKASLALGRASDVKLILAALQEFASENDLEITPRRSKLMEEMLWECAPSRVSVPAGDIRPADSVLPVVRSGN